MRDLDYIPVYMIAGFLESGKTTMILDMLKDPTFTINSPHTKAFFHNTSLAILEEPEVQTSHLLK